jgi:replicative DNA helicase
MQIRIDPKIIEAAAVAMVCQKSGGAPEDLTDNDRLMAVANLGPQAEAAIRAAVHPAMPHNLSAEQALLGVLMFDNGVYERLPDALKPEHFHEPFHGRLFGEIENFIRKGMLAEPTILIDRFRDDPAFHEFGGLRYLADLMDRAPPAANAGDYTHAILDLARRRTLMAIGADMVIDAPDPDHEAADVAEGVESRIFAMMEAGQAGSGVVTFATALAGAVQMVSNAFQRDGKLAGLSTYLDDVDRLLGGLHPSDLLILAGRPSMGKTALATNIAFNVARNYRWEPDPSQPHGRRTVSGGQVLFFSLEMSGEQLAMRILADASGISSDRLRKGEIDASEFGLIRDASIEINDSPLYIDATGGLAIAKLAARARRQMRKTGLDLIIVDYLQLAQASLLRRDGNRVEAISEITGALKALAKELGVPIIALSQLSRQVENREDKRPQLSDLRESGSIEQDADVVMFVYREAYYLSRTEPREGTPEHIEWQSSMAELENVADLIIGKQRHGPIGTVNLAFDGNTTRFGNLARSYDYRGAVRDPSTSQSEYA